jgi:hypothetical protein
VGLEFHPDDASFNRANALYLAHASDIAYIRTPADAARERLGLDRVFSFHNKVTRTRGFLGVCDTHAVLCFRGSDPITLQTWLTDAIVRLVERNEYTGRVHLGFSSVLKQTWDKVEPTFDKIGDRPLFLTGHSMGGALAVLTACRLANKGRLPTATYTYGSPRIGDRDFCAGYSLPTYRIVNKLDLVPEMPAISVKRILLEKPRVKHEKIANHLKSLAEKVPCYDHVKTLVYIDRDGAITPNADIAPWYPIAVARAIATRGKSFHEGITDHMITSYIRSLEGHVSKRQTGVRRRIRVD